MSSYFDEHDCEPLRDGEQPNHLLHLARLLLDTGLAREWDIEYSSLFGGEGASPPASKEFVKNLPVINITLREVAREKKCPVCLKEYEEGERAKQLPCDHDFHPDCILPWLEKTNTCPLCREELPTDDERYEEHKRDKARAKQRQHDLDALHDSMFG